MRALFLALTVATSCGAELTELSPTMAESVGGQVPVGAVFWVEELPDGSGRVAVPLVTPEGDTLIPAGARLVDPHVIEIAGVRQPLDVTTVERRGSLTAYRLNEPIESYASLTYRRFY